jgi:hypothetical protein
LSGFEDPPEPLNGLELELVVGKLDDDGLNVTAGGLVVVAEEKVGVDVDVGAGIPGTESCWGLKLGIGFSNERERLTDMGWTPMPAPIHSLLNSSGWVSQAFPMETDQTEGKLRITNGRPSSTPNKRQEGHPPSRK